MLHVGELITISETKSVAALRAHGSKVLLGTVGDSRFQAHGITMEFEAISNGYSRNLRRVNNIHKSCEQPSKQKRRQTIESKSELDRIIGVGSARTILAALAPLQGPFERKTSQAIDKLSSLSDCIFEALFETSQHPVLLHQAVRPSPA